MRRNLVTGLMAAVLVGVMVAGMTALAAASASQYWELDSEAGVPDGGSIRQMERVGGPGDDGQSGSVDIPAGQSYVWIADEAAATDVTFPEGDWVAYMCLATGWADECGVEVGTWDGSDFSAFSVNNQRMTWDNDKKFIEVKTQTGSETISEGEYLALRVTNNASGARSVQTNGCSSLISPCSDPGYPTPEVATAISLGAGLAGLGLLAILRGRKKVTA